MRIAPSVQRAVATFLFVLYTACAVLGGGLVRCREADGSVAIEWRGAACCGSPQAPEVAPAPVADVPDDAPAECAGCEDEALTKSLASVAVRKSASGDIETSKAPVHVAAACPADRATFLPHDARRPERLRIPIPPPPLLALRSVVLRC
jgi:hypothetical protein